jgi:hypothetical protein
MGCRAGKSSGSNLFGFNSEPSPEALAGSGPSTTYPAPPSDSATPEAIASIAGGTIAPSTSPAKSPGVNPTTSPTSAGTRVANAAGVPSYVTPGASTSSANSQTANVPSGSVRGPNMAAAQSNGFYSKTKPAGFAAPSWNAPVANASSSASGSLKSPGIKIPDMKVPEVKPASLQMPATKSNAGSAASNYAASIPSGYQFGSKSGNSNATAASAYSIPSTKTTSSAATTSSGTSSGFSMPGNFSVPSPKLPSATAAREAVTATFSDAKKTASKTVGDLAADVTEKITSISPDQSAPPSQPAARISSTTRSNYMPGSTSAATGYPGASDGYPTSSTSGSYLR